MGFFMGAGPAYINLRKVDETQIKLRAIEVAFAGYVAVNGRLPCPADGTLPVTDAAAGREDGGILGCNNSQQHGVVPWTTLGLSEADILDGWYNRITYRLGDNLWAARGTDMTACDPAGTEPVPGAGPKLCNPGCLASDLTTCTQASSFLLPPKGLSIVDTTVTPPPANTLMDATATPSTGAAYVLISHGPNGMGAYPANGAPNPSSTTGAGTDEIANANGVAVQASYVDKALNESDTAAHFDDIVLRPSIMSVVIKAGRGPRAH
jgi:hypothetical protein